MDRRVSVACSETEKREPQGSLNGCLPVRDRQPSSLMAELQSDRAWALWGHTARIGLSAA